MGLVTAIAIPAVLSFGVYLFGKTSEYTQLVERMNYDFFFKNTKISTLELSVIIDFWVDNPTDKKHTFGHPFVMMYYDKIWITQNTKNNTKYELKPNGNVTIPGLDFKVSWKKIAEVLAVDYNLIWQTVITLDYNQLNTWLDTFKSKLIFKASFDIDGIPANYQDTLFGLGYSPLSAIERPIKKGTKFDRYFALPTGKNEIVIKNATVYDTVKYMHKIVESDYKLISDFAKTMKQKTTLQTAKKIFDFVFTFIKYNLEKGEQLRNPLVTYHLGQRLARQFYEQNGYYNDEYSADCDDISIFIASILKNLNIKYAFRIASYNSSNGYSHVYAIAFDENNKQIIIDPVYHIFNSEKQYNKQLTYDNKMNTLSGVPVLYLSGIDENKSLENSIYQFIKKSRDIIALRPNKYHRGIIMLQFFDYILKYWNTPNRNKAIQIVIDKAQQFNEVRFFEELQGLVNDISLSGWGDKIKENIKKFTDKISNVTQNNPANNPTSNEVSESQTNINSNNSESVKGTFRDIIAKYNVPIAIGMFVTTTGIIIAVSPKIQQQLGLRKQLPIKK